MDGEGWNDRKDPLVSTDYVPSREDRFSFGGAINPLQGNGGLPKVEGRQRPVPAARRSGGMPVC